jgi:hypothetical protein
MDRASVALDDLDGLVGGHPALRHEPRLIDLYRRAESALADLYREAGRLELDPSLRTPRPSRDDSADPPGWLVRSPKPWSGAGGLSPVACRLPDLAGRER